MELMGGYAASNRVIGTYPKPAYSPPRVNNDPPATFFWLPLQRQVHECWGYRRHLERREAQRGGCGPSTEPEGGGVRVQRGVGKRSQKRDEDLLQPSVQGWQVEGKYDLSASFSHECEFWISAMVVAELVVPLSACAWYRSWSYSNGDSSCPRLHGVGGAL